MLSSVVLDSSNSADIQTEKPIICSVNAEPALILSSVETQTDPLLSVYVQSQTGFSPIGIAELVYLQICKLVWSLSGPCISPAGHCWMFNIVYPYPAKI